MLVNIEVCINSEEREIYYMKHIAGVNEISGIIYDAQNLLFMNVLN